jgi:hypothetical protein
VRSETFDFLREILILHSNEREIRLNENFQSPIPRGDDPKLFVKRCYSRICIVLKVIDVLKDFNAR